VTRGMRVAQLLFVPVVRVTPTPVRSLSTTARGDGGFGSTGLASKA
jgi:dUTP pyrophosphatase